MSGTNGSMGESPLTMVPEGGVEVLDEVTRDLQVAQLFDDSEDLQRCESEQDGKQCLLVADHDATERDEPTPHLYTLPEPIDPDADDSPVSDRDGGEDDDEIEFIGEMTEEQVKAGLQNLSGGVATAQDIENAARAEEGLPPLEAAGLLDFGPFNPDNALKAIFEKSAEVRELQADYERKKDLAKDAKTELDIASKALVNIIESLKNRRTQALNPSQPFLRDVSGDAAAPSMTQSRCPWEREHPGQSCPICTAANAKDLVPALESEVHPEHEGHAAIAEAARVQNVLIPLTKQLQGVNIFVTVEDLQTLSTEDLEALRSYASEPTVMPPHIITKTCIAAKPGILAQVCGTCERVLLSITDPADPDTVVGWYPDGARVGLQHVVQTIEQALEPPTSDEAPRKPRSHAKKNAARKVEPERERAQQTEAGRKAAAKKPTRRHNDKPAKAAKRGKAKR